MLAPKHTHSRAVGVSRPVRRRTPDLDLDLDLDLDRFVRDLSSVAISVLYYLKRKIPPYDQ
jgi:hypothetical protein